MNVLGYKPGPVNCEAAFVADFDISSTISISNFITKLDIDRQTMAVRAGMRSKYVPLRFDPATGAHRIGGRYLFEKWEDVLNYMYFTAEELEFEPGIKFWDRSFFSDIDKQPWHVIGAYEFTPLETHYAGRFERFSYDVIASESMLPSIWTTIRDTAENDGLACVWLLHQPDERQLGLLTVATQTPGTTAEESASISLSRLESKRSLSILFPAQLNVRKIFDRTSLNVSIWLPKSHALGGVPVIFPTFPVHPKPQTAGR